MLKEMKPGVALEISMYYGDGNGNRTKVIYDVDPLTLEKYKRMAAICHRIQTYCMYDYMEENITKLTDLGYADAENLLDEYMVTMPVTEDEQHYVIRDLHTAVVHMGVTDVTKL